MDPIILHIRDPIHGTIPIHKTEIPLIDHPHFQRLRNIKQLGFADLAFPGATHSRYSHSLGAMHVATRLFDRLIPVGSVPSRVRDRFRKTLRLAVLFHDIGHAPLSHTTEILMPQVSTLGLDPRYIVGSQDRQATHEDYTFKLILDSALTMEITKQVASFDIQPPDIVELLLGNGPFTHRFRHGGKDYAPILRQIVSSECDADRMDYLQRDSFYAGVNYGRFDADWLIDNVVAVEHGAAIHLGIHERAMFSFEDFLLSRYHMFSTVYLHHTPVIFEEMLRAYFQDTDDGFTLPSDIESYAALDDIHLWHHLRSSENKWAQFIVHRQPYHLLDERNEAQFVGQQAHGFHARLREELASADIDTIQTRSKSELSKYFKRDTNVQLFVVTTTDEHIPIENYSALYERYQTPALFNRIFVPKAHRARARMIWKNLLANNVGRKSLGDQRPQI